MAEKNAYNVTDSLNVGRWPENMAPSGVNNAGRANEGIEARHYQDNNGSLVTAGTSTVYTVTLNSQHSAFFDGLTFRARIHVASGASPTINPTGSGALGAKSIAWNDGTAVAANELPLSGVFDFEYNSTTDKVHVLSASGTPANFITASSTATFTNKTFDAGGTGNTLSLTADSVDAITEVAAAIKTGADGTLVTGTAGTNGNVASWNTDGDAVDSGVAVSDLDTSPLTPDTALATTSGTTKDFTIPAGANRVTVIFDQVSGSSTDNPIVQLGDSGGIETTGYESVSKEESSPVTSTAGFIVRSPGAANQINGHMLLTRITSNVWVSSHTVHQVSGDQAPKGGGRKSLSGELITVRIAWTGAATFDGGQANVFVE